MYIKTQFLRRLVAEVSGVTYIQQDGWIGGGGDITYSNWGSYVELVYTNKSGDCPSGCLYEESHVFHVYNDCSVEYMGEFSSNNSWPGGPIIVWPPPTVGLNEAEVEAITVGPNPFNNDVVLNGITGDYSYSFRNILGQEVLKGATSGNSIAGVDGLSSGLYVLQIQKDGNTTSFKLIKE
ncbi:MAG: T9SS type A sorting domain-containing protein [Flavobacteriales bacterium]|nr:T9SS type A sorting domain-containing protein [Flavobacteriales bacterium]